MDGHSIRRFLYLWLPMLIILLSCWWADGATRYVSPGGSGSCSQVSPCSLNTGLSQTVGGDTLYLRAGNYPGINGATNLLNSGTAWNNAITIAAFPGETVVITGQVNGNPIGFNQDRHYIIFDGLITDGGEVGVQSGAHHIRFQNMEIRNSPGQGFSSHFDPSGDTNNIELIHSRIHHNGTSTTFDHGIYVNTRDMLIDGNEIYNNTGYGLHVYGSGIHAINVIARNNMIHHNGPIQGGAVLSNGSNIQFYNNTIYSNNRGAEISYNNDGTKVYSNTIYGNSSAGLSIGGPGDVSNAQVRNNIIYGNGSQVIDAGGGVTYSNNLCGSSGTGCALVGNPGFAVAGGDFHIVVAGSPAINAGATLGSPYDVDLEGNNRPSGQYTVGAYQFGGTQPPVPPGTVAKYTFEEGSGTTVADSSGFGHTCILNTAGWAAGIIGNFSLNANGARYCTATGTTALKPTSTLSITVWMNGPAPTAYGDFVVVTGSYGLWHDPNGGIHGFIVTTTGLVSVQSAPNMLTGTNQMLALSKDSTGLRLWIGTAQVAFTATTDPIVYTGSPDLHIGGEPSNGEFVTARVDQVYIDNTPLDQTGVVNRINEASPSPGISTAHMRYYADAAEGAPIKPIDADLQMMSGLIFGMRFGIRNTGALITEYFPLWCARNGGTFTKVSNSFGALGLRIATSTFVTMGQPTTVPLPGNVSIPLEGFTAVPGFFVAGPINTAFTVPLVTTGHTEVEYRVQTGAPAGEGDTFVCQPRRSNDAVFSSYANLRSVTMTGISPPAPLREGGGQQGGTFE